MCWANSGSPKRIYSTGINNIRTEVVVSPWTHLQLPGHSWLWSESSVQHLGWNPTSPTVLRSYCSLESWGWTVGRETLNKITNVYTITYDSDLCHPTFLIYFHLFYAATFVYYTSIFIDIKLVWLIFFASVVTLASLMINTLSESAVIKWKCLFRTAAVTSQSNSLITWQQESWITRMMRIWC